MRRLSWASELKLFQPSTPPEARGRWMLVLPAIGWIWLFVLTILGLAGFDVRRHHFESAGLAFGGGLLVVAFALARGERVDIERAPHGPMGVGLWLGPVVAALIGFGWAIQLGPLSDDFVLRRWAVAGDWTPDEWIHSRPLPLALWHAICAMGGGWKALHALNVGVHAINSALVCRIGTEWLGPRAGVVAGLVFALLPASVEAVAWNAGIFDVVSTTFVLLAVGIFVRGAWSGGALSALILVSIAGVWSKESAIAVPALLALIAGVSARKARDLTKQALPLALTASVGLSFIVVQLFTSPAVADHLQQLPAGRRQWKDLLVRPFAALAVPMRTETGIGSEAYLGGLILLVLIGITLASMFRSSETARQRAFGLAIGTVWIIVAATPLLTQFFVAPTLQGSRYLYLSSVGLALLIASGFAGMRAARSDLIAAALLACLLTLYALRLSGERQVWREAAEIRDRLLAEASEVVRSTPCRTLTVLSAPDSFRGVYVFRNGLEEALAALPMNPDGGACKAQWEGSVLVPVVGRD